MNVFLTFLLLNTLSRGTGPTGAARDSSRDSPLISALLADIAGRQERSDGFFRAGAFPATRVHASRPFKVRADNNIFFTGLIGLGLRRIRGDLRGQDLAVCDSILERIRAAIGPYRNKTGRPTYNFWQTNPPVIFPGDPVLRHLDRTHALPDDLDDTIILLEALGGGGAGTPGGRPGDHGGPDSPDQRPDSLDRVVKALMAAHANGVSGVLETGYRRYRHVGAYSTWFGKNMPIDFDLAVLCNVLYWVCDRHLPFGAADSATVDMLKDMILRKLPVTDPAFASPHYARTPVLLYHIGRLLGTFSIPALDSLKPLLVSEARTALDKTEDPMDKVLLSTTLLRLGVYPGDIPPLRLEGAPGDIGLARPGASHGDEPPGGAVAPGALDQVDEHFVMFIGTFSDYFRNPFRRVFLHSRLLRYEFRCTAYNRFLLLEYLVVRQASWKRPHPGV